MEYASAMGDPNLDKDKDSLERIRRRAVRWITSTYDQKTSATAVLQQLKLEPLEKRRRVNQLAFTYKILNEQVAVPPDKMDLILNNRPVRIDVTLSTTSTPSLHNYRISEILHPADHQSVELLARYHHISGFGIIV